MDARDGENSAQSFRELLQSKINDPKVSAVLIGENHGKSFTPAAILANIDVLDNASRKVIFVAEELEQHANQSPEAVQAALVSQDIKFTDANLYNTLSNHGITVLGGENQQSSPLYGLSGKEREAKGLSPETGKQMSGMERITNGNEAFAGVINDAIQQNPGAVVIFVGGATHPSALEKNGVTDPGMQGRIQGATTINLVKTTNNSDSVQQHVAYQEDGGAGKGMFDYQVESSKENAYKEAFDAQPTLEARAQRLESMTKDLVQSYASYHKSGVMSLKENARIMTEAFKSSNNLPADMKFDNLEKVLAKVTGPVGGGAKPAINYDLKMQKEIESALKADMKANKLEVNSKKDSSSFMSKFKDKAKAALANRRREPISPATVPAAHAICGAAEPARPSAVGNDSMQTQHNSTQMRPSSIGMRK